jgi:hypothetical protein
MLVSKVITGAETPSDQARAAFAREFTTALRGRAATVLV